MYTRYKIAYLYLLLYNYLAYKMMNFEFRTGQLAMKF